MSEGGTNRWWLAPLLATVACFDGRDALGLDCEKDFQCGNGQVCADGTCAWPGDLSGTSAAPTGSSSSGTTGTGTQTSASSTDTGTMPVGDSPFCAEGTPAVVNPVFSVSSLAVSPNAMSVAVGDFTGSGSETIAVLTRRAGEIQSGVQLLEFASGEYLQTGSMLSVEDEPMDMAPGDIDGDGFDDLAVVFDESAPFRLGIVWGGEAGLELDAASTTVVQDDTPYSVAVADIVPGGNLEIVVAIGDQLPAAVLYEVNSDRTLAVPSSVSGVSNSPWDAITVDIDGDGDEEVFIAGSNDAGLDFEGSDEVRAYAAPTGALSRFTDIGTLPAFRSPYGVDAGDVDGDGLLDLVIVGKNVALMTPNPEKSDQPSEFSICLQQPESGFECERRLTAEGVTGFNNVRLGDFDCDGNLDAFIGTGGGLAPGDGDTRIVWGPMTVDSVSERIDAPGPVGNRMQVADVDGDGQPEVVVPIFGSSARVYDVTGGG